MRRIKNADLTNIKSVFEGTDVNAVNKDVSKRIESLNCPDT